MIPNALQPAQVDEVILCQMMGRAIVLVREDQLSLAIGKRGQNVRLASKLCGWDIEIMTQPELEKQIDRAVAGFSTIPGITEELANQLVGEGYLSYDDLSVIEPDDLMEMGSLTAEQVEEIVAVAEERARDAERLSQDDRRRPQNTSSTSPAAEKVKPVAELEMPVAELDMPVTENEPSVDEPSADQSPTDSNEGTANQT